MPAPVDTGPAVGETLPLTGIRVLDLTMVWAGPFATKQLADLGAQIIKVEGPGRLDLTRSLGIPDPTVATPWNDARYFNEFNRNKFDIALDPRTPDGRKILQQLAAVSDILIDNFRSGVVERMGLDYEELKKVNPGLIMISMPAYSSVEPESSLPGYGSNVDQMSGQAHFAGYRGGPPHKLGISYGDPMAGLGGAGAALLAIWNRERTGEGLRVEVSQRNLLIGLLGEAVVATQRGEAPERLGNRDPVLAPQGIYEASDGKYVALTVTGRAEWQALAEAIERPELAARDDLVTSAGRQAAHDELDEVISAWTAGRPSADIIDALRSRGIAVSIVAIAYDLVDDPALVERGFLVDVPHPSLGTMKISVPTWRFEESQRVVHRAPFLGEHNEYVLSEILGYSDDEIARLAAEGVIGDTPAGHVRAGATA